MNDEIYNRSIQHYKHSIDLSKILGAKKYGIHAGFLIDPGLSELGEKITKTHYIIVLIRLIDFVMHTDF